jgi:pimeloyl-ACP methyl ester carboxylesterase
MIGQISNRKLVNVFRWFLVGILPFSLFSCLSLKEDLDFEEVPLDPLGVESYIYERESRVLDIVSGTDKRIVWAQGAGVKTEYSLVYLPGYSATRQEIAPIPERVARSLGMNLFETRFKGNGIEGGTDSYKGVTVQDHLMDAYEALSVGAVLGEKVVLMGTSTGAPFAIWLANRFPEKVAGLVFVSPNNQPADARAGLMLGPFGKQLAYLITGGYYTSGNKDEISYRFYDRGYSSEVQHVDGTLAMMGIVGIAAKINPAGFKVPYLMIYSEGDTVVSVKAFKDFFEQYGTNTRAPKESVSVIGAPGSGQHAMLGDLMDPKTTGPAVQVIIDFLQSNLGKPLPNEQEGQSITRKELSF